MLDCRRSARHAAAGAGSELHELQDFHQLFRHLRTTQIPVHQTLLDSVLRDLGHVDSMLGESPKSLKTSNSRFPNPRLRHRSIGFDSPGGSSSSGVKRTYSESTALPNSPGLSSGSGVKRAHGESDVNDDEEQPGRRARISNLISGHHGVDAAEDDELCSGDGIPDDWLSSWYPETQMSQKMVIEAKRKEMERLKRMKVYRVVTRESMERDEEGKKISIWVITNKRTEEPPIAKARLVAREFNCGDKRGELFAGTPCLTAMRPVISRALTKRGKGARRSIMLADVKQPYCMATQGGRCTLNCHRSQLLVDTWENLIVPCMELEKLL